MDGPLGVPKPRSVLNGEQCFCVNKVKVFVRSMNGTSNDFLSVKQSCLDTGLNFAVESRNTCLMPSSIAMDSIESTEDGQIN